MKRTSIKNLLLMVAVAAMFAGTTQAEDKWVVYEGKDGPGKGKHIVLISGDEEYRSEEAMVQLGRILAVHHGFKCTVLFAQDEDGTSNPINQNNIPGTEALKDADLMIIGTRFRNLPDAQMQPIDDYLKRGGPVLGMRTATHGFKVPRDSKWAHYGNGYRGDKTEWADGFGRLVLGEKWISHHGRHKHQSTRGLIAKGAEDHPINRGVKDGDIWGPTDVYGVRSLPGDSKHIVMGQVVNRAGEFDKEDIHFGMRPTDNVPDPKKNNPMMPVSWTKTYKIPGGKTGRVFTTTMGSSTDLVSAGTRRMTVNGAYWCVGLEDKIPAGGTKVDIVGEFKPRAYGFGAYEKDKKPSDFKL